MVNVPLTPLKHSFGHGNIEDTPSSSAQGDSEYVDDLSCTLRGEPREDNHHAEIPLDHPPIPENSKQATCPVTGQVFKATGQQEIRSCPVTGAFVLTASNNATTVSIGSRASQLAITQTNIVAAQLQQYHASLEFPVFETKTLGDQVQNMPLYTMGKAIWTKELEVFLLDNRVDMVVHSLKDLPTTLPEGCALGAIIEREDPSDAVVMKESLPYKRIEDLPKGSVVGTSSKRRIAQLRRALPHLIVKDMRGNLNTRLRKLNDEQSEFSCLILAAAGLMRIGLGHVITHRMEGEYAVGQGALGVEIRQTDLRTRQLLAPLRHPETTSRCAAERALMRRLEGGCSVPIGVKTFLEPEGEAKDPDTPHYAKLTLNGIVVSVNGDKAISASATRRVRILNQSKYQKQYREKSAQQLFPRVDIAEEDQVIRDAEEVGMSLADDLLKKGAAAILAEMLPNEKPQSVMLNVETRSEALQEASV